jgi:ADP-heptose:LPS heptosyltransferase
MSFFDAMISMDSANMHLAALVGTRVVSIWGATHPFCGFMGWRQRKEDAVQLDMVCRPCSVFGNRPCRRGDFHCMYGISPERIIQTLDAGANKGN